MQKYRYLISIHSFGEICKNRIIMTRSGYVGLQYMCYKERRRESDNISKIGYAAVIGDVSLYFALGVNYNVSL